MYHDEVNTEITKMLQAGIHSRAEADEGFECQRNLLNTPSGIFRAHKYMFENAVHL